MDETRISYFILDGMFGFVWIRFFFPCMMDGSYQRMKKEGRKEREVACACWSSVGIISFVDTHTKTDIKNDRNVTTKGNPSSFRKEIPHRFRNRSYTKNRTEREDLRFESSFRKELFLGFQPEPYDNRNRKGSLSVSSFWDVSYSSYCVVVFETEKQVWKRRHGWKDTAAFVTVMEKKQAHGRIGSCRSRRFRIRTVREPSRKGDPT